MSSNDQEVSKDHEPQDTSVSENPKHEQELSSLTDEERRKLLQPDPTEAQVLEILQTHYCREGSADTPSILARLDSYDDCNFKVKVPNIGVCLLKIHNGVESHDLVRCLNESYNHDFYQEGHMKSVIHLQNAIMELCAENDVTSNQPLRPLQPFKLLLSSSSSSSSSSPVVLVELPVLSKPHSPQMLAVRLLSWTPGRPMSSVPNVTIETLACAGRLLGKLDKVLDHLNVNSLNGVLDKFGSSSSLLGRGSMVNLRASMSMIHHNNSSGQPMSRPPMDRLRNEIMANRSKTQAPTPNTGSSAVIVAAWSSTENGAVLDDSLLIAARRYHQWDGKNTADLLKFTSYIRDERRRDLVLSIINAFQTDIMDSGASKHFRVGVIHGDFNDANILVDNDNAAKVCGVIDFGDSLESWRVLEIAVAMAYAMLTSYGKANLSLSAAAGILRGYNSIYPLTDAEKEHLPLLIACRLACSVTLGAYSFAQNPDNSYLMLHAEPAWKALEMLWPHDTERRIEMNRAARRLFDQACLYGAMGRHETTLSCYDLLVPDPCVSDLLKPVRVRWTDTADGTTAKQEPQQKKLKVDGKPVVTFVTGNAKKLEEVVRILGGGDGATNDLPFYLTNEKVDLPELQGDPINIAREKCLAAAEKVGGGVITEDTSLCFAALKGLPGPYIKWFLESCGHDGLNNLISAYDDKSAYAQTVVAFCKGPGHEPVIFDGRTSGKIVPPRGSLDFGWDPIFEPTEGNSKTYGEMTKEEKDAISHRSRAFQQLRNYCTKFRADVVS